MLTQNSAAKLDTYSLCSQSLTCSLNHKSNSSSARFVSDSQQDKASVPTSALASFTKLGFNTGSKYVESWKTVERNITPSVNDHHLVIATARNQQFWISKDQSAKHCGASSLPSNYSTLRSAQAPSVAQLPCSAVQSNTHRTEPLHHHNFIYLFEGNDICSRKITFHVQAWSPFIVTWCSLLYILPKTTTPYLSQRPLSIIKWIQKFTFNYINSVEEIQHQYVYHSHIQKYFDSSKAANSVQMWHNHTFVKHCTFHRIVHSPSCLTALQEQIKTFQDKWGFENAGEFL